MGLRVYGSELFRGFGSGSRIGGSDLGFGAEG